MSAIGIRPCSRIKGRPALVRRLRGLLVAVHRYGKGRARTPEEVRWAAKMLDRLQHALDGAEGFEGPPWAVPEPGCRWVRVSDVMVDTLKAGAGPVMVKVVEHEGGEIELFCTRVVVEVEPVRWPS